jgi:hypothetical protein
MDKTTNEVERCPDCSRLRQPVQQAGLIGRGSCCKHFPWGSPDVARMAIEDCAAHKARASAQDAGKPDHEQCLKMARKAGVRISMGTHDELVNLIQSVWDAALQHRADSPAVSEQEIEAWIAERTQKGFEILPDCDVVQADYVRELFTGKMLVSAGNKEAEHG